MLQFGTCKVVCQFTQLRPEGLDVSHVIQPALYMSLAVFLQLMITDVLSGACKSAHVGVAIGCNQYL